jgi:hypothetical protein
MSALVLVCIGEVVIDPLLDESEHAGEVGELPELRGIGHDHQDWGRVDHAGRFQERRDNRRRQRMHRAGEVLDDVSNHRIRSVWIEDALGVLVDRSKDPDVASNALDSNVLGLKTAAAADQPDAAVERLQIEHRRSDRRGPDVAPLLSEKDS